jgi:hypothetical protein
MILDLSEEKFVAALDFRHAKELEYALPWLEDVCEATVDIYNAFLTKSANFLFQEYLDAHLYSYALRRTLSFLTFPLMAMYSVFHTFLKDDDIMSYVGASLWNGGVGVLGVLIPTQFHPSRHTKTRLTIFWLSVPLMVYLRFILLIYTFFGLTSLPPKAFQIPWWTQYLPHI